MLLPGGNDELTLLLLFWSGNLFYDCLYLFSLYELEHLTLTPGSLLRALFDDRLITLLVVPVKCLRIGTWNVRTLMDSAGSDRPQRRTTLVGRELGRYGIQIAASGLGSQMLGRSKKLALDTPSSGVDAKVERREAGIGFAFKTYLVGKLSGLPKGINDRLMTLRLPLSDNKYATIVSVNAPTMTNPDEVKDKFYNDLDDVISATPRTDKLILLGDFNARVGTDHQTWEGVKGPEGVETAMVSCF